MRLLDLFCGAGGAAMGYHRAGFEVMGVDIKPQPRYPFEFVEDEALSFLSDLVHDITCGGEDFDAIHASPPCQAYSDIGKQSTTRHGHEYPDLVAPTRELLKATGLPYVIENVEGAPLIDPVMICGSSVGLDLRRHRLFETNWPLMVPSCAHGWQTRRFRSLDRRLKGLATVVGVHGHLNYTGERELRERAMEIDWMEPHELTQAIPPAYTELIGHQFMQYVKTKTTEGITP